MGFFVYLLNSQLPLHPMQPPEQAHELLPFLRFLKDTKIIAKKITAIIAATINVAKSMPFTPFYFDFTYLFFLKMK